MGGDNSLCLIANLQGLLMELAPVDKEQDLQTFKEEHSWRMNEPSAGSVRYVGVDIFKNNLRTIADYDNMHSNLKLLRNNTRLTMVNDPQFKALQRQAKKAKPGALDQLMVEDV